MKKDQLIFSIVAEKSEIHVNSEVVFLGHAKLKPSTTKNVTKPKKSICFFL